MRMAKKNRIFTSAAAVVMAAVLLALTGTFAWQSISQQAKNEIKAVVNPGGRLHDDFDGENKDIYVENFTTGGTPIYARVRLDEYMEIGDGAGDADGTEGKLAKSLVSTAKLADMSTWTTHVPDETTFSKYWDWETGGQTTYMPTFNKNKDSIKADINGTFEGTVTGDENYFDDYVDYSDSKNAEKTANAIYDNDDNSDEEDVNEDGKNVRIVEETHNAKQTLSGNVITMAEWLNDHVAGDFWVWDTDGWAYWANPIKSQTATAPLLSGIALKKTMEDSWYYSINVVGQFVTADDVGKKDNTGFYDPNGGDAPTENAEKLLEAIGVDVSEASDIVITVNGDTEYTPGGTLQFTADATKDGEALTNPTVTWEISGNSSNDTTIDNSGKLTVGADEANSVTVTVTVDDGNGNTETKTFTVTKKAADPGDTFDIETVTTAAVQDVVTIDGIDWYVLAQDPGNNQTLLMSKDFVTEKHFDDNGTNRWKDCSLREYLNGEWLEAHTTVKKYAKATTIKTVWEFDTTNLDETTDKMFLLSEPDVFSTNGSTGTTSEMFTYAGRSLSALEKDSICIVMDENNEYSKGPWWTRSPEMSDNYGNRVVTTGGDSSRYMNKAGGAQCGVRPVFWFDWGD